jgi:CcmD family protein
MQALYVVLFINLIIWIGLFAYVFVLNKKLSVLREQIKRLKGERKKDGK